MQWRFVWNVASRMEPVKRYWLILDFDTIYHKNVTTQEKVAANGVFLV